MYSELFPNSQRELIRLVRADRTQEQLADAVGVGTTRSSIGKYERGELAASMAVIDYCLRELSRQFTGKPLATQEAASLIEQALQKLRS